MTGDVLAILADPTAGFAQDWPNHVREGRFAVLYTKRRMLPRMGRKAAAKAAFERQSALEALMGYGTVLPALPGTAMRAEDAAATLRAHAPTLAALADDLNGRAQFQLQIQYDTAAAQEWLTGNPATLDARMKDKVAGHSDPALAALDLQMLDLPVTHGIALNRVLLIEQEQEQALDAAVEEIDALWTEGLNIRLIGPAPAVSFASIGLKRVDADRVAQSFKRLGLDVTASDQDIRKAYRAAVMQTPNDATELRDAAEIATIAQTGGTGMSPIHRLFTWSEGQSSVEPSAERNVA